MAPAAPRVWPWMDLVELMGSVSAWAPKTLVDGGGFGGVVGLGAGAVGVDVADVFGGEPGVAQGSCGWRRRLRRRRLGDVAGVGGHAEADDLGVDGGVAGERGVEGFEGEHGGAFAEGHAVAVGGEGAAGVGETTRMAVPGAEEAEGEWGFVAAGDGCVDDAGADHLEGEADGVGSGGAGGGDVEDGAWMPRSMEMWLEPAEAMVRRR